MAALANRNKGATVESTTNALLRTSIADPRPPLPGASVSTPGAGGMAARRLKPGLKLSDIQGVSSGAQGAGLGAGRPIAAPASSAPKRPAQGDLGTPFANFQKIVDPSGLLNFNGKAVLHAQGVNFSSGASFNINMTEFDLQDELGKGNYGTVRKVLHTPTNVTMAMKEIRLVLDEQQLKAIVMELDILHRAACPEIVDFYGAFFIESCVYYCMEFMDAGSLDKLEGDGIPEDVLCRITGGMVRGLRFLKDELQIMHRDVKPTNVLISRKGAVKLCDFGVSGQLEKSIAKTNIGCQSYMAPERIKGESMNELGTYTVSSDVWSLGLSVIELAMGRYPYPPETYANVFAQLSAIVQGDPPTLPDGFSSQANDFVVKCLQKEPTRRATYAELLEHPWLVADQTREVDMPGWVASAMAKREAEKEKQTLAELGL